MIKHCERYADFKENMNPTHRKTLSHLIKAATASITAATLAGCMTPQATAYDNEEFVSGNAYSHSFAGTGPATCEAARRALLSQGYIVTEATATQVTGNKKFQRDRNSHAQIDFSVVCAPNSEGSNTTTAFANAVRQTYSLKKSSTSASVGVGMLGSVSMPVGSSDESIVKIGAETISSEKFYAQFFERVETYLDVVAPVKVEQGAEPLVPEK